MAHRRAPRADVDDMKGRNRLSSWLRDARGVEWLEYAILAGLIVVAAIAVIGAVGGKVLAR